MRVALYKCALVIRVGARRPFTQCGNFFEHDNSDAVLLTDASNAFNSLNRAAALHNIRVLCPSIATYAINTYREPALVDGDPDKGDEF